MRGLLVLLVALMAGLVTWMVQYASSEQDAYDKCWAKGGVQVKTVKFSNGTVCIDREAVIE